jgi:hypothetical protein
MSTETDTTSLVPSKLSPYAKFKMALKSKEVQRQYPSLLGKFLDFCKFEGFDIEQKTFLKNFAFSKTARSIWTRDRGKEVSDER